MFQNENSKNIVYCISADTYMSKGIAKKIKKKFGTITNINKKVGDVLFTKSGEWNILHLVIKDNFHANVESKYVEKTLLNLRNKCIEEKINHFAIYLYPENLDEFKKLIIKTFENDDIKIYIFSEAKNNNILKNKDKLNTLGQENLRIPLKLPFNGDEFDSIIDTGSRWNIIDISLVPENAEITQTNTQLEGPTGEDLKIFGETTIDIKIKNKDFVLNTLVGQNISSKIILGLKFLLLNNSIINFESGFFQIGSKRKGNFVRISLDKNWILTTLGNSLSNTIHLINEVTIQPRSEKSVEVAIPHKFLARPTHHIITITALPHFENTTGIITYTDSNNTDKLHIKLFNTTLQPQKLLKNTCIGKLNLMQQQDIIHNVREKTYTGKIVRNKDNELCDIEGTPFKINKNLSSSQKEKIENLLIKYYNIFTTDPLNMGRAKIPPYEIKLTDTKPVALKAYKLTITERAEMKNILRKLAKAGVISRSTSNYASPAFLKRKSDGNYRFLCNFAQVNEKIEHDRNAVPRINNIFLAMGGSSFFSRLDANSGFFQAPLHPNSKKYTAILVDNELWEFNVLPQGLRTSPAAFSRLMAQNFGDNLYQDLVVYMDDLCAFGKTFDTALYSLEKTLKTLENINLKLKTEKCEFLQNEIELLGHKINEKGINTLDKNIKTISDFPRPKTKKQVRRFLGACSYYRKFIQNFSKISSNISDLTKGDPKSKEPVKWTKIHEKEFENLKKLLITPPVLAIFRQNRETKVEIDASARAVGGVLSQLDEETNHWHPVSYYSEKMPARYTNEIAYDLELTALIKTLNHFREYLYGPKKFTVFTDHLSLTHIAKSKQQPSRRLARMVEKLSDYNFEIKFKKGNANKVPDFLSRIQNILDTENKNDSLIEKETNFDSNIQSDEFSSTIENEKTLSKSKLLQDQENDIFCKNMKEACLKNLEKAKNYELSEDGLLKFKFNSNHENKIVPVTPKNLIKFIIQSHHDNIIGGGHFGQRKTYKKIKNFYFWPGMSRDINAFVRTCDSCQKIKKNKKDKEPGLLRPIPIENGNLFEHLEMDFMGPLPISGGKKYILIATCRTSKYACAMATANADSKAVIKFLKQFITTFSCPQKITSDRGTHFKNEDVHNFCTDHGIKLSHSTSFAPQTQGNVERLNQTVCEIMKHYVQKNPNSWSLNLPYVIFDYNVTPISNFGGLSPYYILFGQEPILPINLKLGNIPEKLNRNEQIDNLGKIRSEIQTLIHKTQTNNKKYYDKTHREISFEEGEEVLVTNPVPDIGKFSEKFKGPFKIIKKISPLNYIVRIPMRGEMSDEILHVRRLKKYHARVNDKSALSDTDLSECGEDETNVPQTSTQHKSENVEKRKVGRPRKLTNINENTTVETDNEINKAGVRNVKVENTYEDEKTETGIRKQPPRTGKTDNQHHSTKVFTNTGKRGPGRPKKLQEQQINEKAENVEKRKVGRPRKTPLNTNTESEKEIQKKGPGRPRKQEKTSDRVHNLHEIFSTWKLTEKENFDQDDRNLNLFFNNMEEYVQHFSRLIQIEKDSEKEKFSNMTLNNVQIKWHKVNDKEHTYDGTIWSPKIKYFRSQVPEREEVSIVGYNDGYDILNLKGETFEYPPEENTVIKIRIKNRINIIDQNIDNYTVIPKYRNSSFDRMQTALQNLLTGTELNSDIIQTILQPTHEQERMKFTGLTDKKELNKQQLQAVELALSQPLTLIQGPPGTGKTTTARVIISELLRLYAPILVCAPSNVATDNLANALKSDGKKVIRIQTRARKSEEKKVPDPTEAELLEADVICTTCCNAGNPILANLNFQATLIDEAAQATEPESIIPITKTKNKLILIGDHFQLRPIICNKNSKKDGLDISLFERIYKAGGKIHALEKQHRMPKFLANVVSDLFYAGKLKSGSEVEKCEDDTSVKFVPCYTHETRLPGGTSCVNKGEIVSMIHEIGPLLENGVLPGDITILTPYLGQRDEARKAFREGGWPVEVHNIDAYQGKETDYIILSTVRSNDEGNVGFLTDWRRLNVALTRAKKKLIIVGNPHTLSNAPLWRNLFRKL